MPKRRPTSDRIEELSEKKARLDAQLAALSARARLENKKDEDRLKWLLGSLVFDNLNEDQTLKDFVQRNLPARLSKRDRNRGLWEKLFPDERY